MVTRILISLLLLLVMLSGCTRIEYVEVIEYVDRVEYIEKSHPSWPVYSGNITVSQAIEILERSRYSHEYYLNDIKKYLDVKTGRRSKEEMLEFHLNCVNNYNAVIALIERLDDETVQ